MIPDDLRYTDAHEWVRDLGDGEVRVGITDYAQNQLGDVVFVQLPDEGADVQAGAAVGEVESTKSVSELFAPVSGTVVAVNAALADTPEVINSAPVRRRLDVRRQGERHARGPARRGRVPRARRGMTGPGARQTRAVGLSGTATDPATRTHPQEETPR